MSGWRKSSRSDTGGCVEVNIGDRTTQVRDTKDRQGPVLAFEHADWRALVVDLHAGRLVR